MVFSLGNLYSKVIESHYIDFVSFPKFLWDCHTTYIRKLAAASSDLRFHFSALHVMLCNVWVIHFHLRSTTYFTICPTLDSINGVVLLSTFVCLFTFIHKALKSLSSGFVSSTLAYIDQNSLYVSLDVFSLWDSSSSALPSTSIGFCSKLSSFICAFSTFVLRSTLLIFSIRLLTLDWDKKLCQSLFIKFCTWLRPRQL